MTRFQGILPAVVTPFDADERFNPAAFETLLARVYAAGVDGIYVCGSTGEGIIQPVEQRKRVAEAAVRYSPAGKQVIVHIGAYRTAEAIELARHASKIGASAVSSLPPAGYPFKEVAAYYRELAAASDVPLLVYFAPCISSGVQTAEQVLELISIPNVVGLKFTDFDLYKLQTIKETGVTVFNGHDEVLAAGLLMGADGGIGTFYNLIPELFVKLYRLAAENRWQETQPVQKKINELIRLTLRFPMLQAVKQMLAWSGVDCGNCLRPRQPLTDGQRSGLEEALLQSSYAGAAFAPQAAKK